MTGQAKRGMLLMPDEITGKVERFQWYFLVP
jgi:hypothetical protein